MATKGALANIDQEAVLERLASGVLSKVIASEFGVSPFGLRKKLAQHPDYKEAIAQQADSFVQDAMEELFSVDLALDMVAIARARARADIAFKYARAHNPAYADKSQIEVTHVDLGERLRRAKERTIEGERVAQTPNAALLPPVDADCKDESAT